MSGPFVKPFEGNMKMLKSIVFVMACLAFSSNAFAACARGVDGRIVCGEGAAAGGYNPNTGNAWKAETNARGVTMTETSRGGEAKTKNGMGVVQTPGGKTCAKGRYNKGCN
jgi:hypothetical protein